MSLDSSRLFWGWGATAAETPRRPGHILETQDLNEWPAVLEPHVNLLIHDWQPSLGLRLALDQLPLESCPERQMQLNRTQLGSLYRLSVHPVEKALFCELAEGLEAFMQITGARQFQLTMGRAQAQMCPLFHVDRVMLRFFVTLRGPGTEWLDNQDVHRCGLGKGDNSKILRIGAKIHRLSTFQIALMKGEQVGGSGTRGIVHRSPPLQVDDGGRWFLKIDARRP